MRARAFTLIELLIVIAIIALLIGILLPALGKARASSRGLLCLTQIKQLSSGWTLYADNNSDVMVPGRAPNLAGGAGNPANYYDCGTGPKFRPTWLARMGAYIGINPFDQPAIATDPLVGREDYTNKFFQCPVTPEWKDERNHCYGYNYQFLGNSRQTANKYHNYPVRRSKILFPAQTVMAGDNLGTAASFAEADRLPYNNQGRDDKEIGNEGFGMDPPRVTAVSDKQALPDRSGPDARHSKRVNVVFLDSHAEAKSIDQLGFVIDGTGKFLDDSSTGPRPSNALFSGSAQDDDPPALPQ